MASSLTPGRRWPGPEYHISVLFRAPLEFAYRWCVDFDPVDSKLEGESYQRRILSRTSNRVVYEDLETTGDGWHWARVEVRLLPPDRWRMESVGNYRSVRAEYQLTRVAADRTRFDLWFKRQPGPLEGPRMTKLQRERALTRGWRRFAKALEKDYSKSHRAKARE